MFKIVSGLYGVGHLFDSRALIEQRLREMFSDLGTVRFVIHGDLVEVYPDGWCYPYPGWSSVDQIASYQEVRP